MTYAINDSLTNGIRYYITNKVKHTETDDAQGHVWSCQDTTYDEGSSAGTSPSVGLPTTYTTYYYSPS
ncbi:hypothetical protein KDI_37420 [Dictyobacter arantiisoli]|uniref:Uncharacterized protein n=2 Tax=Dictyobacter arantiisoli TaxID=2014874 RepID=A0A5A5TFZ9_9CHLR|nr:hypothetical protein KDI_37420 [Dictyobacter arantiisoli]